ncbi:hypothetical protein VNO77_38836 [Canavalia gladiata]|uniref:Uncharacterized protein n=1 Tax=Canavalia gladiata TaxID=3824 RepID=A0AAN9KC00_CANGL
MGLVQRMNACMASGFDAERLWERIRTYILQVLLIVRVGLRAQPATRRYEQLELLLLLIPLPSYWGVSSCGIWLIHLRWPDAVLDFVEARGAIF